MLDGFPNKPRILHGAFVEYGLSPTPLRVVFQFNPVQLVRNRSLSYSAPNAARTKSLREFHKRYKDLKALRDEQIVNMQEETIQFELRLDATDRLEAGDRITQQFGIAPQLATLELMVCPKDENVIGQALRSLPGLSKGFGFIRSPKPPLVLFIWGRKRILPVNINSFNITEILYNPDLAPTRATVNVNLTVIEGNSPSYLYSQAMKEGMSALNVTYLTDTNNVVIPG